jgi:UDP-2-acetamido-3-amino-2,3-dideoxy-glucuronate N-acetyltransferase
MGDNCRPQNYALVSETAILGEGVFVGPAAVLTKTDIPAPSPQRGREKRAEQVVRITRRR